MEFIRLRRLGVYALGVFLFLACKPKMDLEEPEIKEENSSILKENPELINRNDSYSFTEGPAADHEGNVFFTDQPNNRILKWSVENEQIETYLQPAGRSNGLYVDKENNLLACADEKFEMWKISPSKEIEVIIKQYEGQDFNGPNDLWIDEQGGIYFTDPYYQRPYWERTEKDIETEGIYYVTPDYQSITQLDTDYVRANGIIGSPDGKLLYVADQGGKKTYVYDIESSGQLANRRLFVDLGSDGMTTDVLGNVYLTGDGVHIFDPKGELIHYIAVAENWTANVCFGGKDFKTLFITASKSLYTMEMNVQGVRPK